MIFNLIITAAAFIAIAITLAVELKRDLMMFQQNSYRAERYGRWLSTSGDTTSFWRLGALALFFLALSTLSRPWISMILTLGFGVACISKLCSTKYKKPLVWTARAKRIYSVAILIAIAIVAICDSLFCSFDVIEIIYVSCLVLLGCYCGSHIIILASNIVLKPVESAITGNYIKDARNRLASMPELKIVGITGSYGKTSTKHYLHHILSSQFDTLMTPGSFNTTMGVVRTIREYLKPFNEIFIVEMGAKSPGDIREICELVHPSVGIVTAVGPQHLESFKTIDRVQSTKFELVDSLPSDGLAILNNDFEKIADRPVHNTRCIRYSVANDNSDYRAVDITYSSLGTQFTVEGPDGWNLKVSTRLLGECNVSNLVAAIVAARSLGVPDKKIASAVSTIEPVEHRLSIKRTPSGVTILDDAFNSNPLGSRMAVEVLGKFDSGKRIIITPGMIELGDEQEPLNHEFGRFIARNADVAIIVGEYNRDAIRTGILEERFDENNLHVVSSFSEAQQVLAGLVNSGDTVLYENDLPDTFK